MKLKVDMWIQLAFRGAIAVAVALVSRALMHDYDMKKSSWINSMHAQYSEATPALMTMKAAL